MKNIYNSTGFIFFVLSIVYLFLTRCDDDNIKDHDSDNKWLRIESGASTILYDIEFTDKQHGWVVGDSGVILHSENGGETWERQICLINDVLWAVDFIDSNYGWICSCNDILSTCDGGKQWDIKYSDNFGEGRLHDIKFSDRNTGFVVGEKGGGSTGILLKTGDSGQTWQEISINSVSTLTNISIFDEHNIWICGYGGIILSSEDNGVTWKKKNLDISPAPSLTKIQFVDQNNGWTGSRDDWLGFFRTIDGGNKWIQRSKESLSIFGVHTFFFVDTLIGWLGTFPGAVQYAIAQTTDGGQTWLFLPEDMNIYNVSSFCFINKNLGWAIGMEEVNTSLKGVILCYRNVN